MITVGDKEYIYYAGYNGGHKNFTDRTINFATMRRDGFVSRDARAQEGKLVTRLFRFDANQVTVNADVRGELKLSILDENSEAIPGFQKSDIDAIRGDSTAHAVRSRGKLAELKGRPVQLEFSLRDTNLFGFELA